ncbi:MAG TPA: phosphoenolpyruvate--protein phosphotransferase [Thermoanaerobaculia bacterium]|nr:phosphoenolpyruvate--protein phosphotransferase [Thermoanaerobaculia bacterium]
MTDREMQTIEGLGVSGGIAIGRAVVIENRARDIFRLPLPPEEVEREVARFHEAVEQARSEVAKTRDRASEDLGEHLGAIFDAHLLVLCDTGFLEEVSARIRQEEVNAEWAVYRAGEEYAERFAAMENEYIRERQADLRDVLRHLQRRLQGISHHELADVEGPVVIVADDLAPSEVIQLGRQRVVGFAIETGGRTSHTAIIARSLKLPAVSGLGEVTELVTDQDPVVIDGERGVVILHPTPELLDSYRRRMEELRTRELTFLETRDLPARTLDGVELHLMANIDLPEELADVRSFGARGIGLYRSEFLYIEKSPDVPSEEEHVELYRRLVEAASPEPVIIRTYDLGGRKLAQELLALDEENPVLGLRGIRLTLARPQVFKTQVRALYRAAAHGDLRVLLPMISGVDEVRAFRALAEAVIEELEGEGLEFRRDPPLGVMIEVPSAALIADLLAREVDFLSVGTNDLIQYSLAVDRNNEHVSYLYQPGHPAILRMLRTVIEAAREADVELSLCGEMAADPRYAALLVGLGLRRFSVTPQAVPALKTLLRELSVPWLEQLAGRCLEASTGPEVEELLSSAFETMLAAPTGSA